MKFLGDFFEALTFVALYMRNVKMKAQGERKFEKF